MWSYLCMHSLHVVHVWHSFHIGQMLLGRSYLYSNPLQPQRECLTNVFGHLQESSLEDYNNLFQSCFNKTNDEILFINEHL